jgi:hypothetical protein
MKRIAYVLILFITVPAVVLLATRSLLASPQRGQSKGTSVLTGVVIGPNDKPVARAAVSYQSSSGSAAHAVHTDTHGRFTISRLPADNYDIRASANGVFSEWEKNVTIHHGETRTITLHLIYAKQMPKAAVAASKAE